MRGTRACLGGVLAAAVVTSSAPAGAAEASPPPDKAHAVWLASVYAGATFGPVNAWTDDPSTFALRPLAFDVIGGVAFGDRLLLGGMFQVQLSVPSWTVGPCSLEDATCTGLVLGLGPALRYRFGSGATRPWLGGAIAMLAQLDQLAGPLRSRTTTPADDPSCKGDFCTDMAPDGPRYHRALFGPSVALDVGVDWLDPVARETRGGVFIRYSLFLPVAGSPGDMPEAAGRGWAQGLGLGVSGGYF